MMPTFWQPWQSPEVLDRIEREHRTTPRRGEERAMEDGLGEVLALLDRFESATLFNGDRAWHLLPASAQCSKDLVPDYNFTIRGVFALDGGRRWICYAYNHRTDAVHWLACRVDPPIDVQNELSWQAPERRLLDKPVEIPLLGSSLAALLDAALASDGDLAPLRVGSFEQVLRG